MVHPVKRRQANVQRVQQLLAGISYIRSQKQISNLDRLAKYMERDHEVKKTEVERQLHCAVLDNLILSYTGVGFKGSKTGVEYEGFRIPDPGEVEPDDDGHDWYCFECHQPGEMYACSDCWRVFHADCQDEDTDDINYMCAVCKSARKKKKTKRKLLNTLLSYTIVRLKEKTRELHRIGHREEEKKYMPLFVYKAMDLNKMEQKVMAHKYKCIEEFLADAHNILHNMVLIYGDEVGGMTELAKIMIRDCKYDIDEMAQCQNCYYMSNAKPRDWFAQPCVLPGSSKATPAVESMPDRVAKQRVHVSAFLSEHCLPFSLAGDILELSKCLAKDKPALERVTLSPTSVTYINTHGLAKSFKEELKSKMKNRFVSLNLDEATNKNNDKVLNILVQYFDVENNKVAIDHLGSRIQNVATAPEIVKSIGSVLDEYDLKWSQIVSVLMDNCSTMRGVKKGVEPLIREKNNHLLDISGDTVHMMSNVAKALMTNIDVDVQSICSDIYYDVEESPKVKEILHDIMGMMNSETTKQIMRPISSRFLQMQDVTTRLIEVLDYVTVYYAAFLTPEEKNKYSDLLGQIFQRHKVSDEAKAAITLVQMAQEQQQKSKTSQDRKDRIIDAIFTRRTETITMLNLCRGLLAVFQDPPHELVYAKLKGYSYWPAKVIHYINSDRYDVRFFGGLHQRAVIPKDQIKPIDADLKKLNIKKTGGFVKAVEELGIHKDMLQERKDAEVVAEDDDEDEEEVSHHETQKEKRRKSKAPVDEDDLNEEKPYKAKKEKKRKHKDDVDEVPNEKEKKRKKKEDGFDFEDHVETVSSSSFSSTKKSKSKKVSSPDDIVTSTEEYPPPNKKSRLSTSSTASQTSKKHTTASTTVSSTQTDDQSVGTAEQSTTQIEGKTETTPAPPQIKADDPPVLESSTEPKACNCDAKYNKQLSEMKEKLDKEHRDEKQKALDELSERLHKDFEEDKQQAVSRAMSKLQTELDRVRRQTEDKCKEQYKDEMKKLAQKHKETISATKKKQWCYNCEEEAMYHCCWNTSYCSVKCQQEHWHKEHKRVCRRKR